MTRRDLDGPVFATELSEAVPISTGPDDTGPGTRPRICFLHGLFGQGKNWTSVAKALAPVADVLLVDLPDHGRSAWSSEFSYSAMAAAVADLLRRAGDGRPYVLVGHSMGGKVAMMLALEHPELVERLGVVDVSPVSYGGLRQFGTYVEGMRALDLTALPDRATADRELRPYVDDPVVRSFLLQNLRRGTDPAGPRWQWQMNLQLLGDHLAAIGDWPESVTRPYPGPVLWIAGEQSSYVTPAYASTMRALFPRTQLLTVKGASHWVHADRPDVFVAALRSFARLT